MKYLVICMRHNYWNKYDHVVFWGKNNNGYEYDLAKCQLYTKEEAKKIVSSGSNEDCYIALRYLGITEEEFNSIKTGTLQTVCRKTYEICKYVNTFVRIQENIKLMKH